jgi:predicted enzyme related to lactoylglutathione lyase
MAARHPALPLERVIMHNHAISWFEIPVSDLDRASAFYGKVVGQPLVREQMGPQDLAVFPFERNSGIGGCIMSADYLRPGSTGNMIYLVIKDGIDQALTRVQQAGGSVAQGKTALPGDMGHYAHIIDSEGNRVGLHAA